MGWTKRGVIFAPSGEADWMRSHAQVPTVLACGGSLRVFFSSRDADGRSRVSYFDVDAGDPSRVLRVRHEPVLDLGARGAFDENGVMPCSLVDGGSCLYLYYIGWSEGDGTPYRLATGLAASHDGGETFERVRPDPVMGRSIEEPTIATSPFVRREGPAWRLWYASGTGWVRIHDRLEPLYRIRHAISSDGVSWTRDASNPVPSLDPLETTSRPAIVQDGALYRMWFSYRGSVDYRGGSGSYRIGYAESADGRDWRRLDGAAGLGISASGWDSEMVEYCCVVDAGGRRLMFYNGNGFGRTGIGYAVWEED